MKILAFILYLACIVISGIVMTSVGYPMMTIQWWGIVLCVAFSYAIGKLSS